MYVKNNRLRDAERNLEGVGELDSYSWNAMMDGYSMNGCYDDAIEFFVNLLYQSLLFDYLALSIVLTACGGWSMSNWGSRFMVFL